MSGGGLVELDLGELDWTVRLLRLRAVATTAPPDAELLAAARAGVPARVPGCVHTDLLAAGLIPEPFLDGAEGEVRWIGESDWRYETWIDLPDLGDAARDELVLDGVQTCARVLIDDRPVAELASMHREHRIDPGAMASGRHRLTLDFASAALAMLDADDGTLPYDWAYPYNRLRIMASSVGWDWGPTLVTAGLWRPARWQRWAGARLRTSVRTELSDDLAEGTVVVDIELDGASGLVEVVADGRSVSGVIDGAGQLRVTVQRPRLWWPAGEGRPDRYDVQVRLVGSDQVARHRVGFRQVALDASPDEHGEAFRLVVNGRPLFARGANWIPGDALIARAGHHRERVEQARAAHLNLLRVWGGGVYEDDRFYGACDELGVLVWQDFAFACAAYPETPAIAAEIDREARFQVRRLRGHPAVVLWNGSNEALQGWADWDWPDRVGDQGWGETYYRRVLPEVVGAEHPGTPYIPSSPFATMADAGPNTDSSGTVHLWDQWNVRDHASYREHVPRFVAEFGYQAPAMTSTLVAVTPDAQLSVAGLAGRQKQPGGMARIVARMEGNLPSPQTLETRFVDWSWAAQLNQADALTTAIEHFRSHWPRTAGAVVWQLNDCWPAVSWSLIDHGGRLKPAYQAVKRAFSPRLVSLHLRDGEPHLVLINDTREDWSAEVVVSRQHIVDGTLASERLAMLVPPSAVVVRRVDVGLATPRSRRDEVLVAEDASWLDAPVAERPAGRAWLPLCRADGVRWPKPEVVVTGTRSTAEGVVIDLRSDVLVSGLTLLVDALGADAALLPVLLPGETAQLLVAGIDRLDRETAQAAVRTRNQLWHR
ncbi:MAG: glycoside hydrolase family 2 protein [Micropruina sp.]|uniref:glycoside hydrolase family 2 protein n=1 Tax=Micropruina sp. TaxID=2737536 RepID=UPI0039E564BB